KSEAAPPFWTPAQPENWLWSSATINRVAGRVHWKVPDDVRKLVAEAGAERDLAKGAALYKKYQEAMVDAAHHFVLIQPIYQVAVRKSVSGLKLTAAGWMAELGGAKPTGCPPSARAERSVVAGPLLVGGASKKGPSTTPRFARLRSG